MICPHCGHEFPVLAARERQLLTPKEMQTVRHLLDGLSRNKMIADEMGTTEQVIKNRFRSIYRKLQIRSRVELARLTSSELEGLHARTR